MSSCFSRIGQKLYGYAVSKLPDYITNQTASQVKKKITAEIDRYNKVVFDKSDATFNTYLKIVHQKLENEKENCQKTITRLNGAYYQDPKSGLKQAWDKLVASIKLVLGLDIVTRDQLSSLTGLSSEVQKDVEEYRYKEGARDAAVSRLHEILSVQQSERSEPKIFQDLNQEKTRLSKRQHELCGDYFGDKDSLLDQAWSACAAEDKTPEDEEHFQNLEQERRANEARLVELDQQLGLPVHPTRNYQVLAQDEVSEEIDKLARERARINA